MNKKFFAGLVPLLAITAFAVMPAAAQAEPHWYKKNVLVGPLPVTVATSGSLTFSALGTSIKCKVSDTEEIWNPAGRWRRPRSCNDVHALRLQNKRSLTYLPERRSRSHGNWSWLALPSGDYASAWLGDSRRNRKGATGRQMQRG